ncbi:MAG: ABC transporter ATP-binding protein [Bacilli bacterium]
MIEINDLSLIIKNNKILDNIDITFKPGLIYGIVGPNGSGKSSLFKIITSLYTRYSGTINIDGSIASIIEEACLYDYLSGYNNLCVVCDLLNIDKKRINKMIELFSMEKYIYKKFKTYSLGMKQRLYLATAFIMESDIIILDEPTNGLDPIGIIELKKYVKSLNKTVLYSTHSILDINNFCDRVVFLKEGKLMLNTVNKNDIESVFRKVYNI